MNGSPWCLSWCADPAVAALIVDHYGRQKPNAKQFMPPGRKLVLKTVATDPQTGLPYAAWGTSWPYEQYVNRDWADAWLNSLFCRKGGPDRASDLIPWAVAHTRAWWPGVMPGHGFVTMVDAAKVRPKDGKYRTDGVGWCYRKAGWRHAGYTKAGLHVFQQLPGDMPEPSPVPGAPAALFGDAA